MDKGARQIIFVANSTVRILLQIVVGPEQILVTILSVLATIPMSLPRLPKSQQMSGSSLKESSLNCTGTAESATKGLPV
jgi:hypothetical protein